MTSVVYDPAAQFEVQTTDTVYLERPAGSLQATIYHPKGDGPFPACWTFTAAVGS